MGYWPSMLKTNTKSEGSGNVTCMKFKNRTRTQVHTRCPISGSLIWLVVWNFFTSKFGLCRLLVVDFHYVRGHALDFKTYGKTYTEELEGFFLLISFIFLLFWYFSRLHRRWRFLNIQMKGAWWSASTYLWICFDNFNGTFLKNRLSVVKCPLWEVEGHLTPATSFTDDVSIKGL